MRNSNILFRAQVTDIRAGGEMGWKIWRLSFQRGPEEAFGRILNRDLFLFLLDLEVKRARRYQNFLCLLLLKIKQFSKEDNGGGLQACYQTLSNLLMEEIRESDIIGSLELDKLVVLLPYADV